MRDALEASVNHLPGQWNSDDIDVNIRGLVDVLNQLPGISTLGSCGGHERPIDEIGQRPIGEWFVTFSASLKRGGWRSIELLASLYSFPDAKVSLGVYSNCFGRTTGRSHTFILEGHGCDPFVVELLIRDIVRPGFVPGIEIIRV